MANLKEIRSRIGSVSSTMQITSAMKMVSAAKLKRAQDAITAMRPYSQKLTELLQNLSATLDGDTGGKFSKQREVNNVLVIATTKTLLTSRCLENFPPVSPSNVALRFCNNSVSF